MAEKSVVLEIKRQASPDAPATWERFELPWRPGMNVISAMMEIAANPTTADLAAAGLDIETKTWQLIDRAKGRGLRVGGAMMSELHCNFMINTGDATAADLENLGEEVRRRVLEDCGVTLRWEIKRVGEKSA